MNDNGNGNDDVVQPIAFGAVDPIHDTQQHGDKAICCDCLRGVLTERLGFLSRHVLHYRAQNDIEGATPVMRGILELLLFARFMELWDPAWDVWLPLPELGYPTPSITVAIKINLGDDADDEPVES